MSRPSFYLIDGHAQIFRAYFAPFRDLTSPTGEPVKATFVFTQMLVNLAELRKPDYLAVVIDHGDETVFRRDIDPDYKAHRPPPPADFHPQEARIIEIVRDSGVPLYEVPRFEADDILATFAMKLKDRFDVYLVSKDKDLRQVLGPGVFMYDVQSDEVTDADRMRAKLGYGPELAIDIQTLIGDSTDNVPGVPGVGEKTALQLLNDFGSIDAIYAGIDKLKSKKKLVENLLAFRDKLPVTRQLVTLRTDVPIEPDLEACRFTGFSPKVAEHLRALGFKSLVARLESTQPKPEPTPSQPMQGSLFDAPASQASDHACYTIVDTPDAFDTFVAALSRQRRIAFDTETTSANPNEASLVGLSFSWHEGESYYVALRGPLGSKTLDESHVLEQLRPILEDATIHKVGQNIKYDLIVMRCAGVTLRGVVADTMLASFILDASQNGYGIDALAMRHLNFRKIATNEVIGSGKNQTTMDRVDPAVVGKYACEDADICWRLDRLLAPRLDATPAQRKLYDELEVPLIEVLASMELAGIMVDRAVLREQSEELAKRIEALREQIHTAAGGMPFNPDSPKQLAEVLFDRLGLKPVKKTKTGFSTDVEVLEKLALDHPVPKLILEYRSLVKLKGTYLDALPEQINPRTGRIHTSFNLTGAATGRLSSSDPNLQNIPIRTDEGRRIRLAFVAPPGHVLLSADYSQIELRVLAHFTQEPALLKAFEADEDIHKAVASEVFGTPLDQVSKDQRGQAKVINFGIIYGITPVGLARRIDGMSVPAAAALIETYSKRFPGIDRFMRECVEQARAQGYVETLLGRRRPLPDIHSGVINIRNMNERMAINSVVQGSAADLIKVAMLNLHRRIEREQLPARMLLQVHDELVLEAPKDDAPRIGEIVRSEMIGAMSLRVPLKVEVGIGANWDEAKA
jgi:DNA polymerase-1